MAFATHANAQSEDSAREELSGTLSELKASNARAKALEKKKTSLENELVNLQQGMVSLAKDTAALEEELSSFEDKLSILEEQKKDRLKALNARQGELSAMLSAMIKLREIPPEAVMAMPGKLDETLATARALGLVAHAIQAESESLKAQIGELNELEVKITQNRKTIVSKKQKLDEKQKTLSSKVKERGQLEAELGGKEQAEKQHVAQLTAKSQNLQELLDSLQKSDRSSLWKSDSALSRKKDTSTAHHRMRSFEDAKEDLPLPAAGKIISHYGNAGAGTAFSKGIVEETREGAPVVAPYDGEVVFAGPFRDYGRMVIIRHSDDYHTVLAGMEHVDATPGQFLLEGEPIGAMGKRAGGNHLYIELRKDGRPVDPLPWFKG